MCEVAKQMLKDAVENNYRMNRINSTTKSDLDDFIDSISREQFYEVAYSEFDQTESDAEVVFSDSYRTATNSEGVDKSIVTSAISIPDCKIKALKLKASTTEDVQFLLSTDGTNFFNVNSFDINEIITSSVYIKVTTPDNVISGIIIIYENN